MRDELEVTVEIRRGLEQPWRFRMMTGPMTSVIAPPPHIERRQFEYQFNEVMKAALDKLFAEVST